MCAGVLCIGIELNCIKMLGYTQTVFFVIGQYMHRKGTDLLTVAQSFMFLDSLGLN